EHEVVPLEDARVLAERRRLVLPIVDLADGDLELIFRPRGRHGERDRGEHEHTKAEASTRRTDRRRGSSRSHRVLLLSHSCDHAPAFYAKPRAPPMRPAAAPWTWQHAAAVRRRDRGAASNIPRFCWSRWALHRASRRVSSRPRSMS